MPNTTAELAAARRRLPGVVAEGAARAARMGPAQMAETAKQQTATAVVVVATGVVLPGLYHQVMVARAATTPQRVAVALPAAVPALMAAAGVAAIRRRPLAALAALALILTRRMVLAAAGVAAVPLRATAVRVALAAHMAAVVAVGRPMALRHLRPEAMVRRASSY